MSKTKRAKAHKIQVKRKPGSEGTVQTGATTLLYLDGKLLGGAKSFKFEVDCRSVAKATIELYADVEIDADVPLSPPVVSDVLYMDNNRAITMSTISSYSPTNVPQKRKKHV